MKQLLKALQDLPVYTLHFVVGMIIVTMTDTIVTSLLLGTIALGLITNALTAFAVFMLMFVLIKTINTVANAIGNSGSAFVEAMRGHAHPQS